MKKWFIGCILIPCFVCCKKEGDNNSLFTNSVWYGEYRNFSNQVAPYTFEFGTDSNLIFHNLYGEFPATYSYSKADKKITVDINSGGYVFKATVTDNITLTDITKISGTSPIIVSSTLNKTAQQKLINTIWSGQYSNYGAPVPIKLKFLSETTCDISVHGDPYTPAQDFSRRGGMVRFSYQVPFFGVLLGSTLEGIYLDGTWSTEKQ